MTTPVYTQFPYTYLPNSAPGTVTCFTGPGTLHTVVIEKALTGGLVLQDNGVTFASFAVAVAAGDYPFDCGISKNLTAITTASEFVTIIGGAT